MGGWGGEEVGGDVGGEGGKKSETKRPEAALVATLPTHLGLLGSTAHTRVTNNANGETSRETANADSEASAKVNKAAAAKERGL